LSSVALAKEDAVERAFIAILNRRRNADRTQRFSFTFTFLQTR